MNREQKPVQLQVDDEEDIHFQKKLQVDSGFSRIANEMILQKRMTEKIQLEKKMQAAEAQLNQLASELSEKNAKIELIEREKNYFGEHGITLREENRKLTERVNRLSQKSKEEGQWIIDLVKREQVLSEALAQEKLNRTLQTKAYSDKIRKVEALVHQQQAKWSDSENELQDLRMTVEKLNGALRLSEEENFRLQSNEARNAKTVRHREDRVRNHIQNLRGQKAILKSLVEEVRQEVLLATLMNPAIELLKLTEFELGKLQTELIKTPTSEPARRTMESAVDQLVHQRDFLKSLCENGKNEGSVRIKKLNQLLDDPRIEDLAPFPPLVDELKFTGEDE